MNFNSLGFVLLFACTWLVHWIVPHRFRWLVLLVASYAFYMSWHPAYAILLAVSTASAFLCGRQMSHAAASKTARNSWLVVALTANLGLLFVFKYYDFFCGQLAYFCDVTGTPLLSIPVSHVLLPVGISFYTFQTLSYVMDIHSRKIAPERSVGHFALFVSFFPQLVAGPIERAGSLLPQFKAIRRLSPQMVESGLLLAGWGFFKKLVIADRLAQCVDPVFAEPTLYSGWDVYLATLFFAFQIYCDFSGYCDIATGVARTLGIRFSVNFARPYFATSIGDFWRRWHITLTSWFRDYLYFPLGGNRVSVVRWFRNVLLVFVLSALWHGANWTFVVWGLLHAGYFLWHRGYRTVTSRLSFTSRRLPGGTIAARAVATLLTFHAVLFAWIFFRAETLGDALLLAQRLLFWQRTADTLTATVDPVNLVPALVAVLVLLVVESWQEFSPRLTVGDWLRHQSTAVRWACYYTLGFGIVLFGQFSGSEFIYFQF